jgi:CHAT domain-containing protein/tetratricopeptide (TPR) repeat protein
MLLLLTGCGSTSYHMGDPIQAKPQEQISKAGAPQSTTPADTGAEYRNKNAQEKADQWEQKWQQILSPADRVSWSDHMQVCGLKYRFRNYDQLFHCLDLLDAKIAAGGERVPKPELVQRGAPPMTGWLRASAYAELGEPETALKWAETAWADLPEAYRKADNNISKTGMFGGVSDDIWPVMYVAGTLGSAGLGFENIETAEGMLHEGRNNPAALDFRPPMVTMSVAVQRALLNFRLGNADKANAAIADLKRWEDNRWIVSNGYGLGIPVASKIKPWKGRAQLLSIGTSFAQGDYERVIGIYEQLAQKVAAQRQHESSMKVFSLVAGGGITESLLSRADARLFSVAVEDVSNALLYAQSLSRLGRIDQARTMLDTLLAMPEIRAMGNLYWVALYERGTIAFKQGQSKEGIGYLIRSVDAIESVRSTISFEAAKIGFAGDKQTVYAALIAALAQSGDWPQAFLYVERAKARALVDLLAQRRDLGPPPSADDKVRALFANASTVDSSVGLASADGTVRGIKLVADSRDALSTAAPEAASLISVQKVGISEVVARLGADETLIDYYVQGDDLFAIVLHGQSIKGFRLPAKGLTDDVRAFREAIDRRDAGARVVGQRLHERLIGPLLPEIQDARLIIAPHGVLHYLPFAALPEGDGYLIDRFSLRLIPSASTLVYLRIGEPKKLGKLLALGNPDLGSRTLDLPNAQVEAVTIAGMFPDSRALVRGNATKTAVKELGNGFSMLHFATHGKFDANAPLSSGLYLAKGAEPSGVLTVSDLYSLRWDVDLVTLSACETGLGKVANGDDVIGLTRGFLYAGARSIVASLWEVDDAATAHLMESFYKNLAEHDKREALRLAQIDTRQQFPEPWYWAAFNILGRAD